MGKMSIREKFETLRGKPIRIFTGNPMDIPCVEVSDPNLLCRCPVVSVSMITYNHEPYIRQAIEGVMMQQTNFEFELVIGDDCSTDCTREICFEYQKLYPNRIRVLYCDHNLYRNPHSAGGNSRRNICHCRGTFIALCEGDDYWIDPLKLQKQVDIMRSCSEIVYCYTRARVFSNLPDNHPRVKGMDKLMPRNSDGTWNYELGTCRFGLHSQEEFWSNRHECPRTATVMCRSDAYRALYAEYEILRWALVVGDKKLWCGLPFYGKSYYLQDVTAVYRLSDAGICVSGFGLNPLIAIDGSLIEMYFSMIRGLRGDIVYRVIDIMLVRLEDCKDDRARKEVVRQILHFIKSEHIMRDVSWKMRLRLLLFMVTKNISSLNCGFRKVLSIINNE